MENPTVFTSAPNMASPESETARSHRDRERVYRFWWRVRLQRWIDWVLFLPCCGPLLLSLTVLFRYKIPDIQRLRAEYQELLKEKTPLLICGNHLTYIDSVIIIAAFGSTPWYIRNFRGLSWNLPAVEYQKSNLFFRVVGYLSKCIFIDRKGGGGHHQLVLGVSKRLLEEGEILTIFPEGRRSKTGRFDREHLTAGAGQLVTSLKGCRVLCVYVRGDQQGLASKFPKRHSSFFVKTQLIRPTFSSVGREGRNDVVKQIGDTIAGLEAAYFAKS